MTLRIAADASSLYCTRQNTVKIRLGGVAILKMG